jgi:peptide/nickel transport system substrate-binding protein
MYLIFLIINCGGDHERGAQKLELLFEQGRLSRRAFLRRAAALGLAATLSPVLMPRQTYADTPKRGGRLRMGLNGGATSDTWIRGSSWL